MIYALVHKFLQNEMIEQIPEISPDSSIPPVPGFREGRIPPARPGSLQERINVILGKHAKERSWSSLGDDKQMLMQSLIEKYGREFS